ncbi:MAG: peptide-methionine (S)-S-oxide reductase MsrA [Parcubacteria group bacterium]|nr:peptide-methionine (S)-S-oxide reductase MsrA [Parcubacteria group bacterium]
MTTINLEKATFAAGCFWGVEEAFRKIKGVKDVIVGYVGGHTKHPTYEDVCGGKTGHAEAVHVLFDPKEVSYEVLLQAFWDMHDPTTANRQGPDVGEQYRSAIFFHSATQEIAARKSKETLDTSKKFNNPIVTEITKASPFYRAEEYHQRYFEKHGGGACHV